MLLKSVGDTHRFADHPTKVDRMPGQKESPKKKSQMDIWMWVMLGLLVVLAAAAGVWMAFPKETTHVPGEISVQDAYAMRNAGAFILDVREPDEWNQTHIPGATLIPLLELKSRLSEVPKDKEVVVVCRSGNRSKQGRDILLKAGYEQVTSMKGGMTQWESAGYPTVSGP
jgi:rhodanese-related sulfurtransferase